MIYSTTFQSTSFSRRKTYGGDGGPVVTYVSIHFLLTKEDDAGYNTYKMKKTFQSTSFSRRKTAAIALRLISLSFQSTSFSRRKTSISELLCLHGKFQSTSFSRRKTLREGLQDNVLMFQSTSFSRRKTANIVKIHVLFLYILHNFKSDL